MPFDFRCPVSGCEYEADSWQELRGHINSMRPRDPDHDELEPQKKHMYRTNDRRRNWR